MGDIERDEISSLYSELMTFACQARKLSSQFQRIAHPTTELQEALTSFQARMGNLSQFLLLEDSLLKPDSNSWATRCVMNISPPSQYTEAKTALQRAFGLFTPTGTLSLLSNCNSSNSVHSISTNFRGIYRDWAAPYAEKLLSFLCLSRIGKCETSILRTLSKFEFFAKRLTDFYPRL